MKHLLTASVAVLFAMATSVSAEDVKSGLDIGEHAPAFNVKDVTGPNKGKSLCYRCAYGARPVVTIFTREINDDVANLVKQIDGVVGENQEKKMAAFVVLLTDDADASEAKLTKLAEEKGIKNVPLTIFDGEAGPENYKISKDAGLNVLMWTKHDVKVNYAFAKPALDKETAKKVVGSTAKILE